MHLLHYRLQNIKSFYYNKNIVRERQCGRRTSKRRDIDKTDTVQSDTVNQAAKTKRSIDQRGRVYLRG